MIEQLALCSAVCKVFDSKDDKGDLSAAVHSALRHRFRKYFIDPQV